MGKSVLDFQETLKSLRELQQLTANSDPCAYELIENLLAEAEFESEFAKNLSAAKELLKVYNFADAAIRLSDVKALIGKSPSNQDSLEDQ